MKESTSEAKVRELAAWARTFLAKSNETAEGIFLFDQAASEVRERMERLGVDYRDPRVIIGWFAALGTLMEMISTTTITELDEAVTMTLATGLMGRLVDGDGGSGTEGRGDDAP